MCWSWRVIRITMFSFRRTLLHVLIISKPFTGFNISLCDRKLIKSLIHSRFDALLCDHVLFRHKFCIIFPRFARAKWNPNRFLRASRIQLVTCLSDSSFAESSCSNSIHHPIKRTFAYDAKAIDCRCKIHKLHKLIPPTLEAGEIRFRMGKNSRAQSVNWWREFFPIRDLFVGTYTR